MTAPVTTPDDNGMCETVHGLLRGLPRVPITPETIDQRTIDRWYEREAKYRKQIDSLTAERDRHAAIVQRVQEVLDDYDQQPWPDRPRVGQLADLLREALAAPTGDPS